MRTRQATGDRTTEDVRVAGLEALERSVRRPARRALAGRVRVDLDLGFALARRGASVKTLDLLIAAYALSHSVRLLTTDGRRFLRRAAWIETVTSAASSSTVILTLRFGVATVPTTAFVRGKLAIAVAIVGCAARTSSVSMRLSAPTPASCTAAAEVAGHVASEFGLRNAVPPGTEHYVTTGGWLVLARYSTNRAPVPPLEGSRHNVYLTVFAREGGCGEIDFAIIDYDQGDESEFVRHLQARLKDLLQRAEPDAEFISEGGTVRTLPP